jgi:hypothetical protein
MKITAVGILLLAWLLFVLIRNFKDEKKCFPLLLGTAVFSELFLKLGYVLVFRGSEFNYDELAFLFLFLYSFYLMFRRPIYQKKSFKLLGILAVVLGLGLVLRYFSKTTILSVDHTSTFDDLFTVHASMVPLKVTLYSLVVFFRVLAFGLIAVVGTDYINIASLDRFVNKLFPFLVGYLVFGVIELLCNNLVSPTFIRSIALTLFGSGSSTALVPYFRAGIYSILLTTKEPSLSCYLLLIISFMLIEVAITSKTLPRKRIAIACFILSLILSLSSLALTGMLGLGIIFIFSFFVLFAQKAQRGKSLLLLGIVVLGLCLLPIALPSVVSYIQDKLAGSLDFLNFFLANPEDYSIFTRYGGSIVFRGYSMLNAITVFLKTPFFGAGIGTNVTMSGVLAVLSNTGIFGTILFLLLWHTLLKEAGIPSSGLSFFLCFVFFLFTGGVSDVMYSFSSLILLCLMSLIDARARKRTVSLADFYIVFDKKGRLSYLSKGSLPLYSVADHSTENSEIQIVLPEDVQSAFFA